MPKGYRNLTCGERCRTCALRKIGRSNGEIAAQLGRDRTTVCSEIRRNRGERGYRHKQAQVKASTPISGAPGLGFTIAGPSPPPGLRARCRNGRCCTSEWKSGCKLWLHGVNCDILDAKIRAGTPFPAPSSPNRPVSGNSLRGRHGAGTQSADADRRIPHRGHRAGPLVQGRHPGTADRPSVPLL